jgi:hypothetical protein
VGSDDVLVARHLEVDLDVAHALVERTLRTLERVPLNARIGGVTPNRNRLEGVREVSWFEISIRLVARIWLVGRRRASIRCAIFLHCAAGVAAASGHEQKRKKEDHFIHGGGPQKRH